MTFDARGITEQSATPTCPECGTPLTAPAVGRRPVYCGRGCSSKAYRRRRQAAQEATLAAAINPPRVETPTIPLARLGTLVERLAHQLAADTETTTSDHTAAPATLAALERAVDRLMAEARQSLTPRPPMLSADNTPSPPFSSPSVLSADNIPAETTPAAEPVELDLIPPSHRGLGRPDRSMPLPDLGPDWELTGWSSTATLYLVLNGGHLAGWVERMAGYNQWIAVAEDGYLVHEHTGEPLWHTSPHRAARTVQLALRQSPLTPR